VQHSMIKAQCLLSVAGCRCMGTPPAPAPTPSWRWWAATRMGPLHRGLRWRPHSWWVIIIIIIITRHAQLKPQCCISLHLLFTGCPGRQTRPRPPPPPHTHTHVSAIGID
jgi:hypothetical protein